jgi:beta-barrel assembly-enhancing protease
MLNSPRLSPKSATLRSNWFRRVGSLVTIASLTCTITIASAQAVPLGNLLFQGIQIMQFSNLSQRDEVQLAAQMHDNLLSKGTRLSTDSAVNRYVTDIGQRLVPSSRRSGLAFNFFVVQDKGVNAFATMGGYVYVTTGLLKAADNEAQVASVISHEMGHIEKRHLIAQIKQSMITRGLVSTILGNNSALANIGVDLALNRPRGREDEFQADLVGLRMLRDSNYAVSAMPAFMRKLLRPRGNGPTFLSTHPAVPDRIKALDSAIKSGPTNRCDADPRSSTCGLDDMAYQSTVKQRITI